MTSRILLADNPHRAVNTGDGGDFGDSLYVAFGKFNDVVGQCGVTSVNFGAVPGQGDTSVAVTGQANILAGSTVNAWVIATATADHSADEHWVDAPLITVGNIVPGVGFTIYARAPGPAGGQDSKAGGDAGAPAAYGAWTVGWSWL